MSRLFLQKPNDPLLVLFQAEFRLYNGGIFRANVSDTDIGDVDDIDVRRMRELEINKEHVFVNADACDQYMWKISLDFAWSLMHAWRAGIRAAAPGHEVCFSILANVYHWYFANSEEVGQYGIVPVIRLWSRTNDPDNELRHVERLNSPDDDFALIQFESQIEEVALSQIFNAQGNNIPEFFQREPQLTSQF